MNPYEVLGLSENATKEEIKSAYRRLAIKYHPDVNPSSDADIQFKKIHKAFEQTYSGTWQAEAIRNHQPYQHNKKETFVDNRYTEVAKKEMEDLFNSFDDSFWKRVKAYKKSFAKTFMFLKVANNLITFFLSGFIILLIVSFVSLFFGKLPSKSNIDPSLFNEPKITILQEEKSLVEKYDYYDLPTPKAEITLNSLVINVKSSDSLYSGMMHRGIWLMLADNLKNGEYLNFKYTRDGHYYYPDEPFDKKSLMFTSFHSDEEEIINKIKDIKKGDQIALTGYIYDYYADNWRSISTLESIGGFEYYYIIYINDLKFIKQSPAIAIIKFAKSIIPFLLLIKIILWFLIANIEFWYFEKVFKNVK